MDPLPVEEGWQKALEPVAGDIHRMGQFLCEENAADCGYLPAGTDMLRTFTYPFNEVKVFIIGQDPYPTPGHAMGLSFSVQPDVKPVPRSLTNAFKEYSSSPGFPTPSNGDLVPWCRQGVVSLNRVLTVRPGVATLRRDKRWEVIMEHAIKALVARDQPLVAILWGRGVQSLQCWLPDVDYTCPPHPSPLSTSRGFSGSRPSSQANESLIRQGAIPTGWTLEQEFISLQIGSATIVGWVTRDIGVSQPRRDEISSLNAFLVPDSGTGSNMFAMLSSAYEETQKAGASDIRAVTAALAADAVRGARGNSGTVLLQIFRVVTEAAPDNGIGVESVQHPLKLVVQYVSQAIANPVEGTILTVLRHATIAAEEFEGDSIEELTDTIADAARDALAKTPSQLPVLQRTGVVDAGGAGLATLPDVLADEVSGRAAAPVDLHVDASQVTTVEMEVMYLVSLADTQGVEGLREWSNPLGNSLIIVDDTGNAEVVQYMAHIHIMEPGAVIEAALGFGRPMGIRIEVLNEPAPTPESTRILIAVVSDGPLRNLIVSSGVITINPTPARTPASTPTDCVATANQEFADNTATKALTVMQDADEVVLLPNGLISDQEPADIEFAAAVASPTLAVVSTDSIPAGFAALAVRSAELLLVAAVYAMGEAANGMRTAVVVADVDKSLTDVLTEAISDLLIGGGELATLLLGRGAEGVDTAEVRTWLDKPVEVVAYDVTGIEEPMRIGIE